MHAATRCDALEGSVSVARCFGSSEVTAELVCAQQSLLSEHADCNHCAASCLAISADYFCAESCRFPVGGTSMRPG